MCNKNFADSKKDIDVCMCVCTRARICIYTCMQNYSGYFSSSVEFLALFSELQAAS